MDCRLGRTAARRVRLGGRAAPGHPRADRGRAAARAVAKQALTAAVLRDRAVNDPTGTRWDLDLTSRTVRAADQLAEQVRLGAHLAEALGREVERVVGRAPTCSACASGSRCAYEHGGPPHLRRAGRAGRGPGDARAERRPAVRARRAARRAGRVRGSAGRRGGAPRHRRPPGHRRRGDGRGRRAVAAARAEPAPHRPLRPNRVAPRCCSCCRTCPRRRWRPTRARPRSPTRPPPPSSPSRSANRQAGSSASGRAP